jgi:hypothetical protein
MGFLPCGFFGGRILNFWLWCSRTWPKGIGVRRWRPFSKAGPATMSRAAAAVEGRL